MTVTVWAQGSLRPGWPQREIQTAYYLYTASRERDAVTRFLRAIGEGMSIGTVSGEARVRLRRLGIPF